MSEARVYTFLRIQLLDQTVHPICLPLNLQGQIKYMYIYICIICLNPHDKTRKMK